MLFDPRENCWILLASPERTSRGIDLPQPLKTIDASAGASVYYKVGYAIYQLGV